MKFDVAITFYTPGCALFFPILKAKCCFWPTFKEARTEWPTPCGCLWFCPENCWIKAAMQNTGRNGKETGAQRTMPGGSGNNIPQLKQRK